MNRAAQVLGRLARGVAKSYTPAERARRRERLALLRKRRWPVKATRARRRKAGAPTARAGGARASRA